MKIKDIVNRDIVNLTNCEHEPIHVPGSIQPHGFLLALKTTTKKIDFCSGNVPDYLAYRHEQVLGKTLAEVFGQDTEERVFSYLAKKSASFAPPLTLTFQGKTYNTSIHHSGDAIILEFEIADQYEVSLASFYDQTREFVAYMEKESSLKNLCQRVAEQTRTVTGYDRVMVYKFDRHYNGEVFAESRREDIEPFLGLHYPHTDIPVQARELYKQNLLRLIVDIQYQPVPLYTIDDGADKNLNLGNSILRSVSPIHVQYLANIGVGATLTISLMHENDLWGLIACHHYSPKYIDSFTRSAAQLQGHFITSQIKVRQAAEREASYKGIAVSLETMVSRTYALDRTMFEKIMAQPQLLELCHATGVAIFIEEDIYKAGRVPDESHLKKILAIMRERMPVGVVHTNRLHDSYAEATSICDTASGIIYHSLDDKLNICIMWFRPETITEVKWAGDPNKAIIKDEKGLSPRKSFELWKEEIKLQSSDWTEPEISAASTFAYNLERQIHLLFLNEEQIKFRKLNEVLQETNAELENINWISTHDLNEPLRKIRLFGSRLLETYASELTGPVIDSIKRMNNSAGRMQTLLSDILAYSKLRKNQDMLVDTDLNQVVRDIHRQMEDDHADDTSRLIFTTAPLPVVKGIPFLLGQLFINLFRNSLKFAKPDQQPHITVTATETEMAGKGNVPAGMYYQIAVADNGIGFEDEFNETIFNLFSRLHTQTEYAGTGIGLALCRKIMQIHHGTITAKGHAGEGAQFFLYFPK